MEAAIRTNGGGHPYQWRRPSVPMEAPLRTKGGGIVEQDSTRANTLVLLLSIPHRFALGDSLERRRTIDARIECLFV